MKSHGLQRFAAPPPPPPPKCQAPQCEMAPDVVVPLGEGAINLCWLCAHHHVDHGVPLSQCATSERCEHTPDEIYPRAPGAGFTPNGYYQALMSESGHELKIAEVHGRALVATSPAKPAWCRGRGPDKAPRKRPAR